MQPAQINRMQYPQTSLLEAHAERMKLIREGSEWWRALQPLGLTYLREWLDLYDQARPELH